MNILIVDDDEIARLSLANILSADAAVTQAQDGQEAWDLLEAGLRPDACCCDILMPHLDGLGLLQRARGHPVLSDLPFVLISSASDRQTVESAIAGGAAGYILKPFLAVQTRTTVERVVRDRRQAEAEPTPSTLRRLSVDPRSLRGLLEKLREDALACAEVGSDQGWPQRLRSGSLVLGLWRCAAQLERVGSSTPAALAGAREVAREVARAAERQMAALAAHS